MRYYQEYDRRQLNSGKRTLIFVEPDENVDQLLFYATIPTYCSVIEICV